MQNVIKAAIVAFAFALASPVAAQDYEAGMAAYNLGDYAAALREWRPLAEQGHAKAQNNLGHMYRFGQGVPQDDTEAVKWWRKAAEQGFAQAQFQLGYMYDKGLGVAQDNVQAHMWFSIAAREGDADAAGAETDADRPLTLLRVKSATKSRDKVAGRMTPEQIAEAQKLAREWKPK